MENTKSKQPFNLAILSNKSKVQLIAQQKKILKLKIFLKKKKKTSNKKFTINSQNLEKKIHNQQIHTKNTKHAKKKKENTRLTNIT